MYIKKGSTKLLVRSAVICSILTKDIVAFSGEWLTKDGFCIKKWLKKSQRWLRSEVYICQHAESIKNVFQTEYRFPGCKIIIIRIFNKYIFAKRISMKSWRYLSKHSEGSGRKLISDISGSIQGKILWNQERFPFMFRCPS